MAAQVVSCPDGGVPLYCEEIGVDENSLLSYREASGNLINIGKFKDWTDEESAFEFLVGEVLQTDDLRRALRFAVNSMADINPVADYTDGDDL